MITQEQIQKAKESLQTYKEYSLKTGFVKATKENIYLIKKFRMRKQKNDDILRARTDMRARKDDYQVNLLSIMFTIQWITEEGKRIDATLNDARELFTEDTQVITQAFTDLNNIEVDEELFRNS